MLEYDEVLRKQREIIYNERNSIIDEEDSSQSCRCNATFNVTT
ncbi:hypothetical protein ACVXZ0_06385 [Staphylococcus aureus]